jgi:uncharacterized protein
MSSHRISRRQFVHSAAAAGAALIPGRVWADAAQAGPSSTATTKSIPIERERVLGVVEPFPLSQVRLLKGPFLDAQDADRRYLHFLESDRILHTFRLTAGLPSSAEPLGGWEKPDTEMRGHFGGHYLSACALMYSATGDDELKAKVNAMATQLAACQKALQNGYIGACPEEHFDRLREGRRVICPFYKYHKTMAGLLDVYLHCGNEEALDAVVGMAWWVQHYLESTSDELMQRILQKEFGGMNEVLWNLYAVTGKPLHQNLAERFEKTAFFDPLAGHRDELDGMHGNTHIPQVIGAARRYEMTGEQRYHDIAEYFYRTVTMDRCYCTGGTTYDEFWRTPPGQLATQLGKTNQECCTSYNMLKLARHLYSWTGDPRVMDYYERTLFNSRLGTQNPQDGSMSYFLPLGSGFWKYFNTPYDSFWCCTGTGIEEFAKTGDSIYFHDENNIFVNLFIASEVNWVEKGVLVEQQTRFPEEEGTTLIVHSDRPVEMGLNIRIPWWATAGGTVKVNGMKVEAFSSPSSYLSLDRTWKDGDRVEVSLPMRLHIEAMPDDPTIQATMYGPLVLAGRLGAEGLTAAMFSSETETSPKGDPIPGPAINTSPAEPTGWLKQIPGESLTFQTTGQVRNITLVPLYKLFGERYAVYWKTASTVV